MDKKKPGRLALAKLLNARFFMFFITPDAKRYYIREVTDQRRSMNLTLSEMRQAQSTSVVKRLEEAKQVDLGVWTKD